MVTTRSGSTAPPSKKGELAGQEQNPVLQRRAFALRREARKEQEAQAIRVARKDSTTHDQGKTTSGSQVPPPSTAAAADITTETQAHEPTHSPQSPPITEKTPGPGPLSEAVNKTAEILQQREAAKINVVRRMASTLDATSDATGRVTSATPAATHTAAPKQPTTPAAQPTSADRALRNEFAQFAQDIMELVNMRCDGGVCGTITNGLLKENTNGLVRISSPDD